jgi:hypothetical protein
MPRLIDHGFTISLASYTFRMVLASGSIILPAGI